MDQINEDLIKEISSIISKLNCDYAEARISRSRSSSITLSGEEVDALSSGESVGGSVRVLSRGAWGFVSFNNLRDIEKFARKGVEISSRISGGEKSGIIPGKPAKKKFSTEVKKKFDDIPLDEKFGLIQAYNKILRSSGKVQTTRAIYRDLTSSYAYINSEGSELLYDRSFCGISLSSIAKEGIIIQPFGDSISGYGGYEIVEGREEMAEEVIKTAVDLLKAEPVKGGTYDIIADQKLSGVFIHEAFGHLSEADFIYENERMKEIMTLGKKFGPDELNVIDDGNISPLPGFIPFDDEGIIPERTYLIKKGILNDRLHSRETAYRMKEKPTGNARALSTMSSPIVRMSNTYIEEGTYSREEIFDSLEDGIYAIDVIGGQTNLEMFTFSPGFGYEIKKGKKGKMLRDIVLSGNVFKTLNSIKMIGNDRKMFGGLGGCGKQGQGPLPVSFGGPHMLIKDVLIGGKQ